MPTNRRSLYVLLLLALAGLSLFWLIRPPEEDLVQARSQPTEPVVANPPASAATAVSPTASEPIPAAFTQPLDSAAADPARHRRAYLLSLDSGKLTLEGRQDIDGDFGRNDDRGMESWPGMLRCRLLSATGAVLAEELMRAPDQLCTVLDGGKPVTYRPPGPVIFQARLPRVANAARLDVSRIAARDGAVADIPVGSIPLIP